MKKCLLCGWTGKPKKHTRGSFWLELVLWLMFLWPGMIYSVWRLTTRAEVCGNCKNSGNLIPAIVSELVELK